MSRLTLQNLSVAELASVDLDVEAGVATFLGPGTSGEVDFVRVLAGVSRPKKGRVRIDGEDPYGQPAVRARIGSLFAVEELVDEPTVGTAVARALRLGASGDEAPSGELVLAAAGIATWASRSPRSLSNDETRAVALAIALSRPAPILLALVEPLSTALDRSFVVRQLAARAEAGSVVVCVTASARDAADLGGRIRSLRLGRELRGVVSSITPNVPTASVELVVYSDRAADLFSALSREAAVAASRFEASAEPHGVLVRGTDAEALSLTVLRVASESGVRVDALVGRAIDAPRPSREAAGGAAK